MAVGAVRYKDPNTQQWVPIQTIKGDSGVWYGTTTPPSGYEAWVDPSGTDGWGDLLEVIYPVGSIYMSMNSTNPGTWFGGTWERIQDTFLLAAGTTYAAGDTGGEATHTLTVNEIPSHGHNVTWTPSNIGSGNAFRAMAPNTANTQPTTNTGGGQAHNNMPPYLAVYVWKRTA